MLFVLHLLCPYASLILLWLYTSPSSVKITPFIPYSVQFSLVAQLCWLFVTPWTAACQTSCPSPTPRAYSNSWPSRRWCHRTISTSVIPFSSCLQIFPVSGSFQMSWFFTSGGQSIRVSASASVLPMNIQDWFPLGLTRWISLLSKGLSRVFSNTAVQNHHSSVLSFLYSPTLTSIHD